MQNVFSHKSIFLTLLIVLFYIHKEGNAQPQYELLDELRSHYDSIELLRTHFTQNATSPFGEALPENRGTLLLQGDRYRVETDMQTFVTNGEVTWVYDAYRNQVLINHFVEDEATFSISGFLTDFDAEYELEDSSVKYFNGVKHDIIRLTSRLADSYFKEVVLTIRSNDLTITRLLVTDVNDASMDFELEETEINPVIEGDPFSFIPPDDAEIIDLRS